jgi:hypothetical protein
MAEAELAALVKAVREAAATEAGCSAAASSYSTFRSLKSFAGFVECAAAGGRQSA